MANKRVIMLVAEAVQLADDIVRKRWETAPAPPLMYRWVSKEECEQQTRDIEEGKDWDEKYHILPLFIVDEQYLCCMEVGYGHDIVVDVKTGEIHMHKTGIFQPDWCFLGDFYGYPEGEFFYRVA